ncbi:MAG: hypothetical protein E6G11_07395 [Actinobacteria bacterium]|nr:MAG: hypothetical protein E6G28_06440 [Actinomycetota bacterium]TML70790.1 MAG: hypothetical protein E6G11_07395 [Actinomycetota bacterium]
MILALTLNDWLVALHLWSAFALVASMVLFWVLIVAARDCDSIEETIAYGRVGGIGSKVVGFGFGGTIVFGVWLAFNKDSYAIWDGWILAAIILWVIGGATGGRAGTEYRKALKRAEELKAAGQQEQPGELRALNRSSRGLLLHTISSLAVLLILIDMIWKPGAPSLADLRPSNFNVPLFIHVGGAMILVGGVLTAAAALSFARGDVRQIRFGYFSLLFVAFPGLILTKLGATLIWHKESSHSLMGAAFPHRDDPRWIEIGGTALDGGGALLVLALILGWFGLRRIDGKTDFVAKLPIVGKWTGETLLRLTTLIALALLVGYFIAVWAMAGKPG